MLLNFNVGYLIHSGVSILSVLNDELLISSHGLSQLFIYSQEGRHRSSVTTYDNDKLFDAIWTPHGNILYTTINNKKVVLMSESGKVISIHTHLTAPQHLSASNDGDIYLADGESGIYHSTNNGVNWSLVFKPTEEWSCLQVIKVTTDRSDDFWTLEKKFESIHLRTYTINRKRSEFGITFTDISDDENIKLSTCSSLSFDGNQNIFLNCSDKKAVYVFSANRQYCCQLLSPDHIKNIPYKLAVDVKRQLLYVGQHGGEVAVFHIEI